MPAKEIRIQEDAQALCDRMQLFQSMCTKQVDGYRREDLACVALSACAPRQRRPQSAERFDYMDMETDQEKGDRRRIIHKLYNRLIVEHNQEQTVSTKPALKVTSALSWALLQVTNIDEMRKLEQTLDSTVDIPEYFQSIEAILDGWNLHFKTFLTLPPSSGRGDGEPQALKRRRSKKVKEICIARDEECILTGDREPHVAHISPFSAASAQQTKFILARLWGPDREKAISKKLFPNGTTGIDVIGNVICLSPNMHAAWARYDVALFPMRPSEEKEEGKWCMKVVFYWLKRCSVAKTSSMGSNIWASAREVLLQTAIGIKKQRPRAVDLRTGAPVLDGQIFTIKAAMKDDLPDYDILMLQWDIVRMASLCGAAESGDDYDKDAYDIDDDEEHVEAEMEMTNE
ncbi:hypothetical protein VD0002_g4257 [Verticillium dahliae]|uniref:HNH nuclease domain-containing protein n=2 Tax=Verticillium dahliae TaxID=27337 RepID=G2XDZ6_VERDV|nr:uncharacterized protein VDAG_08378 [Verticillium dahliae VdLs.17]KAF3346747.1 hypothetical protein VdG2_05059 [Verticillium dahliae VDG2]KAH6698784.1 hypothetical protein EV126DRAFT_443491 [Verticillium dahliae]EGY18044.1 hypothetical protein VDAG_08378 [Verticillium dahliae VdLs.17]PNH30680.1 hypothetical protein BJF96_g5947 [Verticillium dahliae]PNH56053.1 hypothetical protein VD0003_g1621 [Verticillium dahliae]